MKVLVISNDFPPVRPWGYALWCSEVCRELQGRGHEITIFTSNTPPSEKIQERGVYRLLHLENDLYYYSIPRFFSHWVKDEQGNRQNILNICARFDPDLIFIWGMYGFSRSIPSVCEVLYPDRTVYYISDHWPANKSFNEVYWSTPATSPVGRLFKPVLAWIAKGIISRQNYPPTLEFRHAIVVSEAVRQDLINAGLPFEHNITINGGSDASRFLYRRPPDEVISARKKLHIIYAGAFGEHKGVHVILDAMVHLRDLLQNNIFDLALFGAGHPDYELALKSQVTNYHLAEWVHFPGSISSMDVPTLLRKNDVLLFPSLYEEPLPRMVEEAMLAGMLVIGTTTGGTIELIIEGQTGLTFPAGDPINLANQIRFAIENPAQVTKIARQGQDHILENYTLEKMVDQIENYLMNIVVG